MPFEDYTAILNCAFNLHVGKVCVYVEMFVLRTRCDFFLFLSLFSLFRYGVSDNAIRRNKEWHIKAYTHELNIKLYDIEQFIIEVQNFNKTNVTLRFIVQNKGIINIYPASIRLEPENRTYSVSVEATRAGLSEVHANSSDRATEVDDVYFIVTVYKSILIDAISSIVGWIYVAAWCLSGYPLMLTNYQRKSVIGLNFDFLALNLLGFVLYSTFNLGLFLIPSVQDEYLKRYPRGLNPVHGSDILQAVHSTLVTVVMIGQSYLYEAGNQKLSTAATAILSIFAMFLCCSLILSSIHAMNWLDFLNICSYIKLVTSLIKYLPQAYMNYKRKSTVGFSIVFVFLDFTGGSFSITQMILNAYNHDDWVSIFGDATKMGLGIFSVTYDVVFLVQHYCLYNQNKQSYEL